MPGCFSGLARCRIMIFRKKLRLKLVIGFLIGVLSIGLFSLYAFYQLDKAKSLIDEQAQVLEMAYALAGHTKDSFRTINIYLFTDDPEALEDLRSDYAISSFNVNKHLSMMRSRDVSIEMLDQLENYSVENDQLLREMIYLHDLKLVRRAGLAGNETADLVVTADGVVDALLLAEIGAKEESLLMHSQAIQANMHAILGLIIEEASSDFDLALLEYDRMRQNTWIILLVIILYSAGLAVVIANSLTKPISSLRDAARDVGNGNLEVSIKVESDDEIGELASAFDKMVSQIKASEGEILDKNKKLSHANEKLKELDKEKDEFIAVAAHELKNPIAAIKSFGQLLVSKKVQGDKRKIAEFSRYINECANDLHQLAINLVDSARLSLGKFGVNIQVTDINPLLRDVETELGAIVRHNHVKPAFSVDKKLPRVNTDPDRLMQVIRNLVINAIHYTPKGGMIEFRAHKKGPDVLFSVRDTGAGIPKNRQAKIFSRFYQAGNKTVEHSSGSGLGLSISKGIVDALGGRIWFESEEGKGTTFYFTLPLSSKKSKE